ncbi:SMP-30/gluconolactonase/LRE family protein [Xanthomonas rydalmerensis]|uniref:SMP-30/gluconolactonase/LRE family protein n=1 Tax=Xanthomonas rydalmerensis TaxID=3046274 RepID=A0ABZ0JLT4_9XANT|nr:SMP-30/gluconolactonase/LRE family protein [Xanthomonas sp. DM-2023]WOS40117.1 SMP-30/gluconolactonase/LRE family protein [Xanthomonas sp. DM-2023]WOS44301.1 SMP-30/gluconolactonase/LRE family protein [Xanthomonas sp. DM-2023]WOS48481.1 SMP-30/gluconolactonase/LRE family protein [Xanthomonas sp. DM-2023]WOS52661.1 SMP-30/gluconolactonase/LRE family protein [Xanthomonas sp. DM-2023]WOS56845.1 SMP-30/gluconolactonase/LRE family protein [Xanthomonas sp. DM-2023]
MRCRPLLAALALLLAAPAGAQEHLFQARDLVGDGVFTDKIEGPATGPDGALYVVNFAHDGSIGRVQHDAEGRAQATLFVDLPDGSIGNGIRFDRRGRMYVADYGKHRILRIALRSKRIEVYAALPGAFQPNDIAMAPDGTLYASDPDWKHNGGQLWRIDRDRSAHLIETGMGTTNGIEVSPDGKRLYVNESVQRRIWVYDRAADGAVSNKRLFASFADAGLDGMRCDVDGNLYVARYDAGKVIVLAPDGTLLHEVATKGRKPTNLAFGGADGRDVDVTLQDRGAIETFRSDRPGREYGR